eukprot:TRINITY_DN5689_c0_g1_i2.p1 TRINITY_DN5689_c0_g1~~TRINITY_DN5689_c0_g1_i2.p1  ORF type:complete len:162 (-),score=39.65 TRINITY_DN5689_c0_g1_i2:76-531(-)
MKNYDLLFGKVGSWLKPNGKLFVQVFSHKTYAYNFIPVDETDWMAKHFFLNGTMPSDDLFLYFQKDLHVVGHWRVDGRNYGKTSLMWLENMDNNISKIYEIFATVYGSDSYKWIIRWRLFFLAVAEMFNFGNGQEWFVSHYLWEKKFVSAL